MFLRGPIHHGSLRGCDRDSISAERDERGVELRTTLINVVAP